MDRDITESSRVGALRADIATGSVGPALLELCALLDEGLPSDSGELAAVIAQATRVDLGGHGGTSFPAQSLGVAILGIDGTLKTANTLFQQCVAEPFDSAPIATLRRNAERHQRAIGLVPARDGGMVCALALSRTLAEQWPILAPFLSAGDRAVAMIVLSPSRSSTAFERAASSAGLSQLEARLAHALLEEDTLQGAADAVGIKRETAKTAIANASRRVKAHGAAELLGVLVDISCTPLPDRDDETDVVRQLFGLTPTEAKVAVAFGRHRSVKEIARALGTTSATVKTHQRAIFSKVGVHRNRSFRRLLAEALALDTLAGLSEVRPQDTKAEAGLRILFRADGRRVAFIDYGPKRGEPVFVGHGDTTGRILPLALVAALRGAGYRPIVLQRPGFGLTARANTGAFLRDAAEDMAFVLDALKLSQTHLLMRDGGAATALAFATRFPSRVLRAALQNPRQPNGVNQRSNNPLGTIQRYLRGNPMLLEPLAEMLRRQSRGDLFKTILRHVGSAVPADRALIDDGPTQDMLVDDMHGMIAISTAGFIDERRIYSDGWQPPAEGVGGRWTVAFSGGLFPDANRTPWANLPGIRFATIAGAGTFAQFTHADEIAALLDNA